MKKDTGFTFQQHKSLGKILKVERIKTFRIDIITSWSYGKTSKTSKLANKLFSALEKLRCELDNIVIEETPRKFNLTHHSEYQRRLDPCLCYYGDGSLEDIQEVEGIEDQFNSGFRPEFRGSSLPYEHQRKRRRSGFTQSEHLHLEQILHNQLQLAKDTAILIKEKYRANPKPCGLDIGKLADKWTEAILCFMNHLNYQVSD